MKNLVTKSNVEFLTKTGKATNKGRDLVRNAVTKDFSAFNGEDTIVVIGGEVDKGKRILSITNANGEVLYAKLELTISDKPFSEPKVKEVADNSTEMELIFE